MKKILIPVILLAALLLFAGCGKTADNNLSASGAVSETIEVPTATPEPTAEPTPEPMVEPTSTPLPSPTARPSAAPGDSAAQTDNNSSSGGTSSTGGGSSSGGSTATQAPQDNRSPMEIANSLSGQSVSALYAAIGSPSSSSYSESCLTEGGEDGWLYYDGFTVTTVKYADGTELVMAAY